MTEKELKDIDSAAKEPDPDALEAEWDDSLDDEEVIDDALEDDAPEDDALEETTKEGESGQTAAEAGAEGADEEALDELEAEELDMLTDDEESETLIVDEAEELRAIRRAELQLEGGGASSEKVEGEFTCASCFLVLKTSQLANKRKKLCRDCAA